MARDKYIIRINESMQRNKGAASGPGCSFFSLTKLLKVILTPGIKGVSVKKKRQNNNYSITKEF